jgi:hypothetical protein
LAAALPLLPAVGAAEDGSHDNVVIVLDASGSMKEAMGASRMRKIDAAKTALKEVLKTIPQSTRVGVLVFSASNVQDPWVYPLGPRDDGKLSAAIDLPQPGGNTPLGTFMKMGADCLLQARKAQFGYGSYRLLVVTDGEANSEPAGLVDRYTPDIMSRGITVDAIGVRMAQRHTLATKVHTYRRADDPASLKQAIAEVFAEVAKPVDDKTGEDVYQALLPIPDEAAAAMIKALSSPGDDPIGEARRAPPPRSEPPAAGAAARPPAPPPPARRTSPMSWPVIVAIAVIVMIGIAKRRR